MTPEERERGMSEAIREKADYHRAPASLSAEILAALPAEAAAPRRPWLVPRFWLAQGSAMAAVALVTWAVTVTWLRPGEDEQHAQDVLAAHVRATLGSHLIDVASADQHTVKPWLSARLPYSPPVTDFSAQGYELAGGRLDQAGGRPVAVLVYHRRKHVIDAYVWPAHEPVGRAEFSSDGFQLVRFAANGWAYWLVSDLNRNELDDFERLVAQKN